MYTIFIVFALIKIKFQFLNNQKTIRIIEDFQKESIS